MKHNFYWIRWLSLIPAFFIGGFVGGALPMVIICSFFDPNGKHFWLDSVLTYTFSGLAASLFCAWVAPRAKKVVGIAAALLISVAQWIVTAPFLIHDKVAQQSVAGWPMIPLVIGYTLGACLAIACLFWMFSKRSISN